MNLQMILTGVVALFLGIGVGFFWYKKTLNEKAKAFKAKMARAREIEEEILEEAKKKAENVVEEAKKKADQIKEQAEDKIIKLEEARMIKIDQIEARLLSREEKIDEKISKLDEDKEKLKAKDLEIQEIINTQNQKLSEIAKLTPEEAKEALFANMQQMYEVDIQKFVDKYKNIKKEEAEKEAAQIIARALPKMAGECVGEFTTILVDLPNEDIKGKLIGREGRNIAFFEKVTGTELMIDDTPMVVRLSCYDHEKRFIGKTTLERLVKDGRINPFYIEKIYNDVVANFEKIMSEKGEEALTLLNLPMMKPEIVRMIGQFSLRYSYGQNLRQHSIEVSKISESIAKEMGENTDLAKKAWLLHDIGKIQATTGQSHTQVGGEILRGHQMDPVIINAAESHHFDVPMTNIISWIVTAADTISASRPGARFNTKDLFIEKMGELEKLISGVHGVEKVHIMQAGREIMVFVNPKEVSDVQLEEVMKTIAEKIEEQLDYPGIIRVTAIRENKLIEYIK